VGSVAGTQTLVRCNFRPSYAAPWMNRTAYREIQEGGEVAALAQLVAAAVLTHSSYTTRRDTRLSPQKTA
jgi:hypothetical protein